MGAKKKPETVESTEPTFTKKQLVGSKRFARRKDILSAMLEQDRMYTISECEQLIKSFDERTDE